jgi:vesicle coat complex subunit
MKSNFTRPCVYASMKSNSGILNWEKMLNANDRNEFEKSMEKEVNGLQDNETFDIKERSSVPKHMKVIQAIWSFRRK